MFQSFISFAALLSGIQVASFLFSSFAFAQTTEIDTVRVIGNTPQAELTKPNSAHVISKDKVELQQQTDANRVLQQVPGVYIQEEDGLGLRPNIGLRGTHPHRSRKVVILEDGILIGPAPYSAPAAYYTPFMSRIESLEVFKGVASVPYGPNSIGGAINYVTRSLPSENRRELDLSGGAFDYQKLRTLLSQKYENHNLMIEGARVQTAGFKQIDRGDTSGFKKNDLLIKGQHLVNSHLQQELSWKLGYADEDSDETYLGLSLDDFYKSPYRRYAASQKDEMIWDHRQLQLTYKLNPQGNWGVWATAYRHQFHRNWSRLNNFDGGVGTPSISDVLKDPTTPANQLFYGALTGEIDSDNVSGNNLVIANNNRYFYSQGLQLGSVVFLEQDTAAHQIKTQLRWHQDQIKRRHTESTYLMRSGSLVDSGNADTVSATNQDTSTALSFSAEDEISVGTYKITASARYETVDYETKNDLANTSSSRNESVLVPGVGVLNQLTDRWSVLLGVNKGVTLVGPNNQESNSPEESVNWELGTRFQDVDKELFAEVIYFRADYKNIKGTCSFSSGCNSNQLDQEFDGGKALIQGVESRFASLLSWKDIYFPLSLNLTLTQAQFATDSTSSNPEWGVGTIKSGDPLPYVPQANYSLSLGTQYQKYTQEFVLNWVGKMYDQAIATDREEIPAHGVVDWSARYQINKEATIYGRVDNLFDNEYLVSLRPFGARPGKDRSWQLGFKYLF